MLCIIDDRLTKIQIQWLTIHTEVVLTSTHNLCLRAKIRKQVAFFRIKLTVSDFSNDFHCLSASGNMLMRKK